MVLHYLAPMRDQAQAWPEDAFVGFAADFLYDVSLGFAHRAGVASTSASIARSFVPIVDSSKFHGEARFRLAEIFRLICAYQPAVVEHGGYAAEFATTGSLSPLELMETAEFRSILAASGRIGYLKHPIRALRRLRPLLERLFRRSEVKGLMTLASTAADAAGAAGIGSAAARALDMSVAPEDASFNPPFIAVGAVELPLYRVALIEGLPGSRPPDGTIMVFKSRFGVTWLNTGEEEKLEREAALGVGPRLEEHRAALRSLDSLVGTERG